VPPAGTSSPHRPAPPPLAAAALHDARAVALRLGVSVRTVRRLIAAGELPAHRIGRSVRVSADDLARFLAARRRAGP
jgi:excisionase family DNA binding protein